MSKPSRSKSSALPPPTPSEAAFDALLATFGREPAPRHASTPQSAGGGDAAAFLDELFAKSATYLERDRYATIGDASEFFTKVVGVTFEGRQDVAGGLQPGDVLELRRDPHNPYDPNAVAVWYGALQVGFLKREIARRLAENFDAGERYHAEVGSVTGGGERSTGINIFVRRERRERERSQAATAGTVSRDDVLTALIGERPLREAQRAVLDRLDAGKNTLAVLGTGRGKSLCFQFPAAVRALETGAKTLVLYPLRALANDQYDALVRRLEPLGLRVFRANGAIESAERAALMDALESGAWDIICSTPEFFGFHLERFQTEASRPSLVVVDEAHHLVESKHRPAYGRIGESIATLGSPQVVALTATASDDVFAGIRSALAIDAWVVDPTVRENLRIVDARGVTNKFAYIDERVRNSGKAIVYCNSRSEATKVAERLRGAAGNHVAFYHAGVSSTDRSAVERLFREGGVRIVVATSAFGEGIDLPDVRNVFLYHLNFDFTEFNQQAGRAGRDGGEAEIHLLFGEGDRRINDFIIERAAPTLYTLRGMYRELRKTAPGGTLHATNADLAAMLDMDKVDAGTVAGAFRIFADAGLVDVGEDDEGRFVRFREVAGKVDLTRNARFAEGEAERENFQKFCELVLTAQASVLENVINRPIYPSNVPLIR
ncbi:MAG: DEAD/DEAH box helicase [Candidatus Velthaea sp.]